MFAWVGANEYQQLVEGFPNTHIYLSSIRKCRYLTCVLLLLQKCGLALPINHLPLLRIYSHSRLSQHSFLALANGPHGPALAPLLFMLKYSCIYIHSFFSPKTRQASRRSWKNSFARTAEEHFLTQPETLCVALILWLPAGLATIVLCFISRSISSLSSRVLLCVLTLFVFLRFLWAFSSSLKTALLWFHNHRTHLVRWSHETHFTFCLWLTLTVVLGVALHRLWRDPGFARLFFEVAGFLFAWDCPRTLSKYKKYEHPKKDPQIFSIEGDPGPATVEAMIGLVPIDPVEQQNSPEGSTPKISRRIDMHPGLERLWPNENRYIVPCFLVVGILLEMVHVVVSSWPTVYRALSIASLWSATLFAVCMLVLYMWTILVLVLLPQQRTEKLLIEASIIAVITPICLLTTTIHFVFLYTKADEHISNQPTLTDLNVSRGFQLLSLPLLLMSFIFSCCQSFRPNDNEVGDNVRSSTSSVSMKGAMKRRCSWSCVRRTSSVPQLDGAVDERAISKTTFFATRLRRLQLERKQMHCPLHDKELGIAAFSLIILIIILGILLAYLLFDAGRKERQRSAVIGLWSSVGFIALLITGILSLTVVRCWARPPSIETPSLMDSGLVSHIQHVPGGSLPGKDVLTFEHSSAYSTPGYSSGTATPTHPPDLASHRGSVLRGKRKDDRIEEEDFAQPPRPLETAPPAPPAIAPMPKRKTTVTFALDGERGIIAHPGDSEDNARSNSGNEGRGRALEWSKDSDEWTTSTGSVLSELAPTAYPSKKRSSSYPFGVDGHLGDCTIVRAPVAAWWTDAVIYDGKKTVRPLHRARPSVLSVIGECSRSSSRVVDEEAGFELQEGIGSPM